MKVVFSSPQCGKFHRRGPKSQAMPTRIVTSAGSRVLNRGMLTKSLFGLENLGPLRQCINEQSELGSSIRYHVLTVPSAHLSRFSPTLTLPDLSGGGHSFLEPYCARRCLRRERTRKGKARHSPLQIPNTKSTYSYVLSADKQGCPAAPLFPIQNNRRSTTPSASQNISFIADVFPWPPQLT